MTGDTTSTDAVSAGSATPDSTAADARATDGATTESAPGRLRRALRPSPLSERDWPWLAWPLLVGLVVTAIYVATNAYPAFGAGLYTLTADAIRANGYALPATVPHYGPRGVPLAYPPLVFYALAVLRDLGAPTFATAMYLPPLITVAALVPAYLLGRDLLGDRRAGTAVALLVGLNPQVLQWHISAGGLVRAPAFLLALCGAYAALRIFRDGETAWVPVGLLGFVLVALTHPTYTLFVVLTYLLFWAGYDRSPLGLARGAVVGLGGALLVSPWLATVASTHGPGVFTGAAGTHGGVGGGLTQLLQYGPSFALLPVAAAVVLLLTRHRVVGVWTLAVWLAFAQSRFTYAVGAVAVVASVVVLTDRYGGGVGATVNANVGTAGRVAVAALLVVSAAGVAGIGYEFAGPDGTTPEFVDDRDVAAMEWAAEETPPDATFVVLGDAAEWFPAVAERTILVSPWGAEWRGPDTYGPHLGAFKNVSRCQSASCVERSLSAVDARPDYLYVPKESYTVRGHDEQNVGTLDRSLALSGRYEPVFENEGVVVFRRTASD
ncbi:glycosyltransferase family 39 protein [Halomicroarcula limicola]|uniref:Glycosyltransferase family 39 protein n=1 Tax=Haloarcula limicola TaxID=1429915 RepID=A0A8J7Y8U2_9EURY|nr:glycosyltransferase family 39 protein [Halomicroarcula limicola]MBV0923898.1 glycosyltransferase family 39 protein [Halomicroarcula limicola]